MRIVVQVAQSKALTYDYDQHHHDDARYDQIDLHVLPPHFVGDSASAHSKLVRIARQQFRPVLEVVQVLSSFHYFINILLHYVGNLFNVSLQTVSIITVNT